jgi:CHASE3 domain sensor protein
MARLTKEILLKKINELDIALEKKEEFLKRVNDSKEISDDLIDWLRAEVQKLIDAHNARVAAKPLSKEVRQEMEKSGKDIDREIKKVSKDIEETIQNTINNFKIQPANAS